MRATVPTSKRESPPPTSTPRSMSTTPKRPSPREARLDQRAVARLEDVQRQHRVREQHRAEREHRQRLRPSRPTLPVASARQFARAGRRAAAGARPARHPRRAGARASASSSRAASANCPSLPSSAGEVAALAGEMPGMRSRSRATQTTALRVALRARVLQVGEHALQDRARADRHRGTRAERVAGRAARRTRSAQPARSSAGAVVERVEPLAGAAADEEVPGHADAVQLEPDAATDLHHEDAQRDRDAEPAVEHVVEVRVARDRRSRTSLPAKPSVTNSRVASSSADSPAADARERVELREPGVDVEVGMRVRGDEERGFVERDLGLRAREQLGEALGRVQGRR